MAIRLITDVQADITDLQALWTTASAQYAARKTTLAEEVDAYVAAHQTAADKHSAEIVAAQAIKATIVPVVAAAETAGSDIESFLLTLPWYQRLVNFFKKNWRYVVYGIGLIGLVYIAIHLHK